MKLYYKQSLVFITSVLMFTGGAFGQLTVSDMFTENRKNPPGLDNMHPRLSWIINSDERQVFQTAYEIRLDDSKSELEKGINLTWSTGKISSGQSVHIPYSGSPLKPGTKYFWQVRVWDNTGNVSGWSKTAWWQTGLLDSSGWEAEWISSGINDETDVSYFRKDFNVSVNREIKSAIVYLTARGLYEARINGSRVGDEYLTPGWTSYNNRIQYQVYDVKDMIDEGENTIGIILGEGWYTGRISRNVYGDETALLAQLVVEYADGTTAVITSDGTWKVSGGPLLSSSIYDGEIYDAGKEITGWDKPGFNALSWENAKTRDYTFDNIVHTVNEPVRKHEELEPIDILISPAGDTIVDFGQNLVGWVRLKTGGRRGDTVILSHAEVLDKEGNFYTENLRGAKQRNVYILNGTEQVFEPSFSWQGFRYVKVKGLGRMPREEDMTAIALYSDMDQTGEFYTSNSDINRLQDNIVWSQKGNFLDVPTDCPQRDERLGWTGDAQVFCTTASFNMNVNNFFSKWLRDLAADQFDDGNVPVVIPNVLGTSFAGSAGWSDAAAIIPWNIYLAYGDKKVLEDQYTGMKAWVDFLVNISNDLLRNNGFHFGDWLFYSLDDDNGGRSAVTDKYLIAQCFFANSVKIVAETASLLGKDEDNKYYSALYGQIKDIFNNEFVTPNGQLVSNTQTAYVLALQFDLLPENMRQQAVSRLIANIREYGNHITTGFLGAPYINHVLSRYGHIDVAYELLLQDTYPSWLYPVKKGATTIWERWNGIKPDGSFQYASMNSFNHYAYGAIGDWMYKVIAGINNEKPGYREFSVYPRPGGQITSASGELSTYYGVIKSEWEIKNDNFIFDIRVPVNTSAKIYLPSSSVDNITEGGKKITEVETVDIVEESGEYVLLILGSGRYSFEVSGYR
ncbi:MAG: family 78 glycoside hydrolase catalytic domain [Bacteroidales bacterium]|nr:family 78 glycoside hydrolase catalytic domain [Bacteroidales bacterium]